VFELKVDGEIDALPDALRTSLYRIVQESLTNALRHGDPGRVVDVRAMGRAVVCGWTTTAPVARGRRRAAAWGSRHA
jgi:signal transduction histidine kinase